MTEPEKVRITVSVDKLTAERVAELAVRMGASQSRMASMLLEAGLQDQEWIVKVVTSKLAKGLIEALGFETRTSEDSIAEEMREQLGGK